MKNKINFILIASMMTVLCFFGAVHAQEDFDFPEEAVINFHADIKVNTDNSVDVVETIRYEAGPYDRHGIYRDIDPYSSTGSKMSIENIEVVDESNIPYMFDVSTSRSNVNIKIGDPDVTFTGQKTYVIKYHATHAVGQFKDFDEIYWNATGNEWPMPIYSASAAVTLPNGAQVTQSACYYGPEGSTQVCELPGSATGLSLGEGLTVAVGFSKGIVVPYSTSDKVSNFFEVYFGMIIAGLLPILTLIFSLRHWNKKGRDPKGTGVIVPQYDAPDGLTPMEVSGIVNQKVTSANISAEIIYLATHGYLKIKQIEEKTLGIFKSTDYELTKLKDFSSLTNNFDKALIDNLFSSEVVKLSALKNVFYTHIQGITDSVFDTLLQKGYYKNLSRLKHGAGRWIIIVFMSVWGPGFLGGFGSVFFGGNPVFFMASIFSSILIYGTVSHFFPAKTSKGVVAKEYILGLKDYLRIAEKDRILFHNAPEKKPEIFEKLLPYAMVLGVADI